MKKHFLFLIALTNLTVVLPQQITIHIKNSEVDKAVLYSLEGEKSFIIDTVYKGAKEIFQIPVSHKLSTGFYRLSLNNDKRVDFIYDNEEVILETDANNIFDRLKVIESKSNKLFYSFLKLNKQYKTKSEVLQLVLARYPNNDEYYQTTKNRLVQLQKEYSSFVNNESQRNANSFIARYFQSAQLPVIDPNLTSDKQLTWLKEHSLDNVDFNDAGLIYSDCFTNKSIEYLMYYRNPNLPKEHLEKEFVKAVDTLLTKAKVNRLVYQHITEYLIDGFKKFGFDEIIDYILNKYVIEDDLCLNEEIESSVKKRIEQAKLLTKELIAPQITLPDINGKSISLSSITAIKTLIVFYAAWCPHCQELLPQIAKLYDYQKKKEVEVFAVSLDSKREEWINFIKENNLKWINVNDEKAGMVNPQMIIIFMQLPR
ncbi:MAG: redoxin domain-containing protein [Bacteroidetes bacterium]|nr:redoxin domain-containing protein [Bacteroidota bacterium]